MGIFLIIKRLRKVDCMRSLDRISEAYYGGMGEAFGRKTRERIHWICSKTNGKNILDVGCSQGIAAILLAREGKIVVGIDIEEAAISYAIGSLKNESEVVRRNVEFFACSIFEYNSPILFDTILLTEVMEHFADPASLLETIHEKLIDRGTVVITVPFGINDFIDHKKTYYLINLLDEIEPFFQVREVKFFGKWVGVVATKQNEKDSIFDRSLIRQMENEFYQIERNLLDELARKENELKNTKSQLAESLTIQNQLKKSITEKTNEHHELMKKLLEKMNSLEAEYKHKSALGNKYEDLLHLYQEESEKKLEFSRKLSEMEVRYELILQKYEELEEKNRILSEANEQSKVMEQNYKEKIEQLQQKYNTLNESLDEADKQSRLLEQRYKEKIEQLEQQIMQKNKEMLQLLENEEQTLIKYKGKIQEFNQLEAKYTQVSKKYQLLSNAKLGRLTLSYWKFRKRIPKNF